MVAAGGARQSLGLRALQALLVTSQVMISYDQDEADDQDQRAGDAAAEALTRQLPHARRAGVAWGKDPTAYWQHWGNVRAWALEVLSGG